MAVRRPAAVAERELLREYPFLPGAERLLGESAPPLRELLDDPAYEGVRSLARRRITVALADPTGTTPVDGLASADDDARYLSFVYARLVLSAAPTRAALRRWAVAEAKGGWERFRRADAETLGEVARRLNRPVEPGAGEQVSMSLPDYLGLATAIREEGYRLATQPLREGRVYLDRERAARLLQEGIRIQLSEPVALETAAVDGIRRAEGPFLGEVADRMPAPVARATAGGALRPDAFPPCIRKFRRMLQESENLSHSGRFALAAFLHRIGADFDTIVDQYRGAPDFDESITRYQVEHITRHGEGEGYTPPECDSLRSHGLCFREGDPTAKAPVDQQRDALCFEPTMRHPLTYYRIRTGGRSGPPRAATPPTGRSKGGGTPSEPGGTPSAAPRR